MKPGCRRFSQQGHSLLELTTTMAVAAILAVAGTVLLDSGRVELTVAHQEIHGSLEQAFTLARARGTNVTVAFGKASGPGDQVVVPFGRRVQWGMPSHIPLPPGMAKPAVATLTGTAHATAATLIVAYEPIWAIGTGKAATSDGANAVLKDFIRPTMSQVWNATIAQNVRILYGGSVNAANAAEYFHQPDIDGALVGGASLKVADFTKIVEAARP